jgi:hypothetical protein
MLHTKAVALIAGTLLSIPLAAQTLEGPAIQVNTFKRGIVPFASQVATAAQGDFAVVWEDQNLTTADIRVWVRRFNANGKPEGREVPVDPSSPKKQQVNPHIAMAAGGNFMVVWDLENHAFYSDVAFGRCFAANGKALGPAFRLDPDPTSRHPDIAAAPDGSFVATWGSGNVDILARRFAADGTPLGPAFTVASPVVYFQSYPRIAVSGNGDVLVAWLAFDPASTLNSILLMARRFDAEDHPLGDELQVARGLNSDYRFSMAMEENGESLFAWLGFIYPNGTNGLLGQRCAADGTPLGEPLMISDTGNVDFVAPPAVAAIPGGGYFVAWSVLSGNMIFGKILTKDGILQGSVVLVGSSDNLIYPAVSIAQNGGGIFTWNDFGRRSWALFLQRFAPGP